MKESKRLKKRGEWRTYLLHCECVRRNSEYRKGYEEWKREATDEYSGEPFLGILRDTVAARWGLLWGEPLPDPDKTSSLNRILQSTPPPSFMLPQEYKVDPAAEKGMAALQLLSPEKPANLSAIAGLLVLNHFPENHPELAQRGVINLRLSKKSIMKSFENYLNVWLKERKDAKLHQRKPSRRVHIEEGITQLEVYDLRKTGATFSQIGRTVFREEKGDPERKAKDYFRLAKRLIESPPLLPC